MKILYFSLFIVTNEIFLAVAYVFCNSNMPIEPTVSDIIVEGFLFQKELINPDFLSLNCENESDEKDVCMNKLRHMPLQILNATFSTAYLLGKLPLPLQSMISDGLYTIDFSNQIDFSFQDVYVIQENYRTIKWICSYLSKLNLNYLQSKFCHCYGSEDIQYNYWLHNNEDPASQAVYKSSSPGQWCISTYPICTSKSVGSNCTVKVDPLRSSCILIKHHIDLSNTESLPKIDYQLEIPTLGSFTNDWLVKLADSHFDIDNLYQDGQEHNFSYTLQVIFSKTLGMLMYILDYTPVYLFLIFVGISILYEAEDLSSNPIFQYVIVALFGALILFFWVVFLFLSTAQNVLNRSMPSSFNYALPLIPTFFGVGYFYSIKSSIVDSALRAFLLFWKHGAFDIKWLGKFVIIGWIIFSILFVKLAGLFRRDPSNNNPTIAERFIYLFLCILGIMVLSQSSSNAEISVLVIAVGFNFENLQYTWYRFEMYLASSNKRYTIRMKPSVLEQVVADHTKRELEKLRQHMTLNRDDINSKFEGNPNYSTIRPLLNRFMEGDYGGVPIKDVKPKNIKYQKFFKILKLIALGILLIATVWLLRFVIIY